MSNDESPDRKSSARLDNARDLLRQASSDFLDDLLWSRLCRRTTELPPLTRDEEPPDLFVDLVVRDPGSELSEDLRRSSSRVANERLNHDRNTDALGHLLYLCSRIDAIGSIASIRIFLDSQPGVFAEVAPGETLQLRATRAYVGLLATLFRSEQSRHAQRNFEEHSATLQRLLGVPDCAIVAATGLIGLQPESRDDLLSRYFPDNQNAWRMIRLGVKVAGFPDGLAASKYSTF